MIKSFLKSNISIHTYKKIRRIYRNIKSRTCSSDLTRLARINATDKGTTHKYTKNYEKHFHKFRKRKVSLLEIGIGGYEASDSGGESLRMWKFYFPKGKIHGIDIYDKKQIEENRIFTYQGSQADEEFLKKVVNNIGNPDIIIDDGSHINEHVIFTFKILFPSLKRGGIYVIEDIQTSYWPDLDYGGDSTNLSNPNTSMNFFKSLTDGLNYEEFINPGYQPTYYDKNITSIHFYHNMVFIYKGDNNEGSNFIQNNIRIKK